jgi:hypothetical protein
MNYRAQKMLNYLENKIRRHLTSTEFLKRVVLREYPNAVLVQEKYVFSKFAVWSHIGVLTTSDWNLASEKEAWFEAWKFTTSRTKKQLDAHDKLLKLMAQTEKERESIVEKQFSAQRKKNEARKAEEAKKKLKN